LKVKVDQEMMKGIIKLAQAIILKQEELETLRKSEDRPDMDGFVGPIQERCEECDD